MQFAAMFLAALALVHSAVCSAQVCPIKIEGVSQQALNSQMGTYGYAIKLTYRNVGPFPVRGIEFGIQALSANDSVSKPSTIIANHALAPYAVDSLLWNATHFDKQNEKKPIYIIWPAVIVLADGSKFGSSAVACGFRTDQGEQVGNDVAVAANPTPAANPDNSTKQLDDLIKSGKASLVNVTSDPPGANVDVDERLIGKTPLSFVLMRTTNGTPRSILVYKEGYTIAGHDVTPNGATLTFNERLSALATR